MQHIDYTPPQPSPQAGRVRDSVGGVICLQTFFDLVLATVAHNHSKGQVTEREGE
jgi:hypothetical protein